MIRFFTLLLRTIGGLIVVCVLGGLLLIGLVMTFGAFFFEETRSQLTLWIILQHVGILLLGLTCVALSLVSGKYLLAWVDTP